MHVVCFCLHRLNDRAKQLEVIKKKDPPVLSLSEMKDVVSMIDQFMNTLEEDVILAKVRFFVLHSFNIFFVLKSDIYGTKLQTCEI